MSLGHLGSSLNPVLSRIWSKGKGKGLVEIKFPFQMDWYHDLPSTQFQSLQHRKHPEGLQHEFIILNMDDGSKCRIERMGDPDARFNALSPQGSVAHDFADYYRPEDLANADPDPSNIIAEITFPRKLDLTDVLKIWRAIHEGDKTRNYTLQGYNCYFFALAIQCSLTRLVSGWENMPLNTTWTSALHNAIDSLPDTYPTLSSVQNQIPLLLRPCLALNSGGVLSLEELLQQVQFKLKSSLDITIQAKHLKSKLWYSDLDSVPLGLVQDGIKYALMEILMEHGSRE